ncbi:MAG: two-component system response regulator [Verrucomicrobiales bacterium]|nr:two-component system response regulator [Verrucomicrobiales bacterium]
MNTGKKLRVVLVDDSSIFRERIAALISVLPGVEIVGQAPDALSGLAFAQAFRPDVMVLDINLPGASGIELLKAVKGHTYPPLVIMLTNHNESQLRDKCFELGAEFYFYKPEEFEKAVEVCRDLGERRFNSASAKGPRDESRRN